MIYQYLKRFASSIKAPSPTRMGANWVNNKKKNNNNSNKTLIREKRYVSNLPSTGQKMVSKIKAKL